MTERYTPFEEFDRLFENMYHTMRGMPRLAGDRAGGYGNGNVRMDRTDEGVVVVADLPGFERDEIDLRYADGVLTIEADNHVEDESSVRSRHVMEQVRVPGEVTIEDVSASYRNGVLEVTIPMHEAADHRYHIRIE